MYRRFVSDRLNYHRHIEVFWPHTSALLNATNAKTLKTASTMNVGEILLQFPIDKKFHVGRFAFKYEVSAFRWGISAAGVRRNPYELNATRFR